MINKKKIAIVGGGPGGLTLARLLQLKGFNVSVFERDANRYVRQQGATLDLHEDAGLKAMRAAGLMEEFKNAYRPGADKMRVTNELAEIFLDDHEEQSANEFGSIYFRPEIDRGPLRDILIESLLPGTITWNSHFANMEKSGEGWTLFFNNGSNLYADIVIAADGANSKLRPYITDIKPIYSGVTVIEGNIYNAEKKAPRLSALLKGGKVFSLGGDKSIIMSAKGDGSLSFYTGTKEEEFWTTQSAIDFTNKTDIHKWFADRFSDWSPLWNELFEHDDTYFIPRPMYHYPLDQSWKTIPNLTMIGDAAHRMPPYAGEGVNMAMLDALDLAEALGNPEFGSVEKAIHHFEKQMCTRASEITKITLEQTESLHAPDALKNLLKMFKAA